MEAVVARAALVAAFVVSLLWASGGSLFAHGTGKHVMGTATAVETDRLVVKTKDGKDVIVALTPKTRFRRSGPAGGSPLVQVGDRVVAEVTESGKDLTATEVRFSTPVGKK